MTHPARPQSYRKRIFLKLRVQRTMGASCPLQPPARLAWRHPAHAASALRASLKWVVHGTRLRATVSSGRLWPSTSLPLWAEFCEDTCASRGTP